MNVPPTIDQELVRTINHRLKDLPVQKGTRLKVQQSYGRTVLDSVMTRDVGTNKICNRPECMICIHDGTKGSCKVEGLTYQISCRRPPCTQLDISTPLDVPTPAPDQPPAALYRGESSRTGYRRSTGHLSSYRRKESKSVLWKHTDKVHSGDLGPDRGLRDYQMSKLGSWSKPLHRLAEEGLYIKELEDLETDGLATCLNSKEDWQQCHKVTLNFNRGSNKEF